MNRFTLVVIVGLLAVLGVGIASLVTDHDPTTAPPVTARAKVSAPTSTATLTGSINITCSQGGCGTFTGYKCDGPANFTSVDVNVDVATIDGHGRDGITLTKNCTGNLGVVTCKTVSEDCLKINGAHDISIGGVGSSISCTGHVSGAHQDGIQVTSGSNISLVGIDDACTSATNGQLYINQTGTSPPTNVYAVGDVFAPDPTHFNNVIVNGSASSGVIDSVICPDARPDPYQVGPMAVNAIDPHDPANGNTFPAKGSGGC